MTRRRRGHMPEQIVRKLAEGNELLVGGADLAELRRHLEIAESTWHHWRAQYGGMKATDAKRLGHRSPADFASESVAHQYVRGEWVNSRSSTGSAQANPPSYEIPLNPLM